MHSVFAGIQFPYGTSVKFKYYLSNFFNRDYKGVDKNGQAVNPYTNYEASIFHFTLSFRLFDRGEFEY